LATPAVPLSNAARANVRCIFDFILKSPFEPGLKIERPLPDQ
jgi:hypothetical protein